MNKNKSIILCALGILLLAAITLHAQTNPPPDPTVLAIQTGLQTAGTIGAPFAGPFAPLVMLVASLLSTLVPTFFGAFIYHHGRKSADK